MNTYTYYGDADGQSATAILNEAIREAVQETGEDGWKAEHIDFCHDEVYNEQRKRFEPEAKVVLRRIQVTA